MFNPPRDASGVEIVPAASEDWERVRHVRLHALADAPFAFGSRLEQEQDRPAAFWGSRLASHAAGTFLAIQGHETVGLVRTFVEPEDVTSAKLVSMWVAPHARGQGVGGRLVSAVVQWARDHGTTCVQLWVTETNAAARRLYESCGFVLSGGRQTLPSDPTLSEVATRLDLGD
jgi:GNAT superfamily N-acetyltransferase